MIRWTERASEELDELTDFIAFENVTAAIRQRERILSAIAQLERFPLSGRPTRVAGLRKLTVAGTQYSISYRAKAGVVIIARIRHAASIRTQV